MSEVTETIQRTVAKLLAGSPAGHRLHLIGGFRYRLLDGSPRVSQDIDYAWEGDLDQKQQEIIDLCNRRLLPDIRSRMGYQGSAQAGTGELADAPSLRVVNLAFWRDAPGSRIEIPVEITRVIRLDAPAVRTAGGTVYSTLSDADMIESKVIALLGRPVIEHRDLVDVFLLADHLAADSDTRVTEKLARLGLQSHAAQRIASLHDSRRYHARSIDAVVAAQIDEPAAANIRCSGGGEMILDAVLGTLEQKLALSRCPP
ncbi:MAG: nucleotidyl transferase AbiEii/AbiGii toxin family protein [Planctomycetaceae bacterium]|nr:nucleotidyl transferase AbiEii/AbiGii toxin family protein [Planctomycetaceae bacterium]